MEPFSALSLAVNIFDLIERAYKGANIVKEIYKAPSGQQVQHAQLENTLNDMEEIWEQLDHDNHHGSIIHNGVQFQEVARKSQEASNAMRMILDECKSKKSGSLHYAVAALVRSWYKRSQIEEQLLILGQCREALKLHIITSTHHEVGELLKNLKRVDFGQQKILGNLQALLDGLHDDDSHNLSLQIGNIKKISYSAVARFNANRIIQSLDVSHTRYDEVIDASPHTYRWIYNDKPGGVKADAPKVSKEALQARTPWQTRLQSGSGVYHIAGRPGGVKADAPKESEDALQARTHWQTWLQSGSGVFHIAGKPGSGKSTLMKFFVKSDGTEKLLKKWADSEELVVLEFFFWKPGSPSQNTLRGLKRSVVAQMLKNVPELSQDLFPNLYQAEYGLGLLEKPIVDSSDVHFAFERLLGSQSISKLRQYKVCLFLDGLDEFNESTERINHADLVKQIMEWVDTSDGRVKAVLSSRQLPAFESIPAVYKIRLQDITKNDIANYVKGTLKVNTNFKRLQSQDSQGCQLMIEELTTRADGVFLWVSLVVQSIKDGLENLDPLTKLRTRIKSTPQELGKLFDQILSKIDQGNYRKEVYLLLAIASTETWAGQPPRELAPEGRDNACPFISLLAAGCLFDEMDSELSLQSMFRDDRRVHGCKGLQSMFRYGRRNHERKRYADSACAIFATRISGRCLGLLEVADDAHYVGRGYSSVKFLHRSIPEYLCNHISKQLDELHIGQIDILNTMAWMVVMELHYLNIMYGDSSFMEYIGTAVQPMWQRMTCHVGYLIHWVTVANIHFQVKLEDTTFQLLSSIDRAISWFSPPKTFSIEPWVNFTSRFSNTLTGACYFGMYQYVEWALARGPKPNPNKWLSTSLLYYTYVGYSRQFDCSTIFQILFDNGIPANCRITYLGNAIRSQITNRTTNQEITIFDNMWFLILGISTSFGGQPSLRSVSPAPSEIWSIIQTFLAHGARPTCFVIWKPAKNGTKRKQRREIPGVNAKIYNHDSFTGPSIKEFDIHSELTGEKVNISQHDGRLKLSSSTRRLFRGLLDEYKDTPSSEQGLPITIHFEDVLRYLSPKNGEDISSLLRKQTPEEQTTSEDDHEKAIATVDGQMKTRDVTKLQWQSSAILVCLIIIFGSLSFWAS